MKSQRVAKDPKEIERAMRLSRQTVLPEIGSLGNSKLAAANVCVVGCGGLGTPVIQYLAGAGIGTMTLVDDDVVELSNLNRQTLHRHLDIGRSKAERAAEFVQELDPSIQITTLDGRISTHNARKLISEHDIILDCTDGIANKYLLNDACVAEKKPLIHAGITAFSAQLMIVEDGGPCLRCVFPHIAGGPAVPTCREAGVLGAGCGVVGSLMALETIKLICGIVSPYRGAYVGIDLFSGAISINKIPADSGCGACGESPIYVGRESLDYESPSCELTLEKVAK